MGDRRLVLSAALCSLLATSACAGVPETGAVHKVDAAANVVAGADNLVQQAQGPQPGASQDDIVNQMLAAMSEGDPNAVKQFFAADYYNTWLTKEPTQTTVFSDKVGPVPVSGQKGGDSVSVSFTVTGTLDQDLSYQRVSGTAPVTFTLTHLAAGWRISGINQNGSFVKASSLPQVAAPVRLYFPSRAAAAGTVPRLVPDTIFMSAHSNDPTYSLQNKVSDIVRQLVGGPSGWLSPAVAVTVPPTTTVLGVDIDQRTNVTTVNLSPPSDRPDVDTLKAQLAYTLQPLLGQGLIQLEFGGAPSGGTFGLQQSLSPGYDPDVLGENSPLYYITPADTLVSTIRRSQSANGQPDVGAGSPGDSPVLDHVQGVRQIAVAPTAGADGVTRIAGVRIDDQGSASLELSSLGNTADKPWVDVAFPDVKALTTPSFAVTGDAVWTVATAKDGKTTLYRVPLVDGVAGGPVPVSVNRAQAPLPGITAFRLSRDGARAALVAGGQAYTAVVAASSAGGTAWTVEGARPVISVDQGSADYDVYWADQSTLGIVVQSLDKKDPGTTLDKASADGYTLSPDAAIVDHVEVAGDYRGATQFAGGPGQLWVATVGTNITRQPQPDPTSDNPDPDNRVWDIVGAGSWPTYAG